MTDFYTARIEKLFYFFPILTHLSRKKLFFRLVLALLRHESVSSYKLAEGLKEGVLQESSQRIIECFYQKAQFNYHYISVFLSLLLPMGKVSLALDRTEWHFGKTAVNILCLTAYCNGVGVPLFFEFLDNNSGNSHTQDRIDILTQAIELLGKDRIAHFTADREFIGQQWIDYLLKEKIHFYIRIRKDHHLLYQGHQFKAEELIQNRSSACLDDVEVWGIKGLSVAIKKVKDKQGKEELLIVLTNDYARTAASIYRKRWSIEVLFQSLKKRGMNLASTHLTKLDRLKKLFALCAVAFTISLHIGLYVNKIKPIPIKNHGYKKFSFARTGRNTIKQLNQEKDLIKKMQTWEAFIDQLYRLITIKMLKMKIL